MKNTLETRLGIFIALAVIAAVVILEVLGGAHFLKPGYRLYALFNNVQELKVGDPVKMAGVQVGQVDRIELVQGKVKVTVKLDRTAEVKTDSVATIKFTGLLGQNYVAIDFGKPDSPRMLPDNPINTTEQPDLSSLMTKLDNVAVGVENLTKSFTGDKIDNLLGPFTDFLKQNGPNLTTTISNIQAVSSQIAKGEGTVGKLIFEDALYTNALATVTNLQDTAAELKTTIAEARKVVDDVNAGQGTIGKLVKDEKLYNETTETMTNLKEILQKINRGEGSIGPLVNDPSFYKNAKMSLQKIDKATEGLEDQGPLSVISIFANQLF
ncbi:MAG: MCE family protein [Verrucomicrobia bacterium]|nr:MCE family protein [Verrucomicrobiota bacterium]